MDKSLLRYRPRLHPLVNLSESSHYEFFRLIGGWWAEDLVIKWLLDSNEFVLGYAGTPLIRELIEIDTTDVAPPITLTLVFSDTAQ